MLLFHLGCVSVLANVPTTGNVTNNSRFELTWNSQVNHDYTIMLSTNLTEGFSESASVQATPPLNTWWEDTAHPIRFYAVSRPVVTNIPHGVPLTTNLLTNGDFSDGLTGWAASANTGLGATGTLSVAGGEFLADITAGGSAQWHIYLRQSPLNLETNVKYVVEFDARATASRIIKLFVQNTSNNPKYLDKDVTLGTVMQHYTLPFTMSAPSDSSVRIQFGLGNDINNVWLDNIKLNKVLQEASPGETRNVAYEINRRLGRGNNFMAAKSMNDQGALEDYILLNTNHFNHCRIGYKMDEVCGSAPDYNIPAANMAVLQKMVDWCLSQGLIPIIDPVHNWANGPGFTAPGDFPKLSNIWVQVATHFVGYDLETVVFEIMNEPHATVPIAADVINTGLAAIRGVAGNETRSVIVAGDNFSTRQALIDAFDFDEIPVDDDYLIGTFHYYDPRPFTKSTHASYTPYWGTPAELAQVAADFDEVLTANINWAARNNTDPLPIYLGEFGCDNDVDNWGFDRKKWLSWVRMQAEERNFSWAHWNMYNTNPTGKGMGPWTSTEQNNPSTRYFEADPVEALIGRYEFEDGAGGGGVVYDDTYAGFTGSGYAAFPASTGVGVWARIDDIYIPKTDTYTLQIHYASDVTRTNRIVSRNDVDGIVETMTAQVFPATGGFSSWKTIAVPITFEAGHTNDLKVVAYDDQGVQLDWLKITK